MTIYDAAARVVNRQDEIIAALVRDGILDDLVDYGCDLQAGCPDEYPRDIEQDAQHIVEVVIAVLDNDPSDL